MKRDRTDNTVSATAGEQGVFFAPLGGGGWSVTDAAKADGTHDQRGEASTSRDAAAAQHPRKLKGDRLTVLAYLDARGQVVVLDSKSGKCNGGATRDQIAADTGLLVATVCGRVNDLMSPAMGMLVHTTMGKRATRSGEKAGVLEITDAGRRELAAAREEQNRKGAA